MQNPQRAMAYVLFCLTMLCYIGLAMLTASKPTLVGDGGMGYGLGLGFLGLSLAISSLALTIFLLAKGHFHWMAGSPEARIGLALLAWLCMVLTVFFCAAFKWEWHSDGDTYPEFLHWLAVNHGQIWLPLLWLTTCFLSINSALTANLPPSTPKGIFYTSLVLSGVYSAGLLIGFLRDSAQTASRTMAEEQQRSDTWHQKVLDDIAAHKPTDSIYGLLSQTTQVRPADTRAAAVAKVKSHPSWETDLLTLLKTKQSYREVYYFLDGNALEHPQQFVEPLKQSMVWLADDIRANITDSNNLQHWSFDMYGIDNLLRGIDGQFPDKSSEFEPNVVRLKLALSTTPPERFKGIRFTAADAVDAWLDKHGH
ncbi:hypothetical protein [Fibrella aquatilis]|uniref:Uncharacterized protein n=1 Tax=Fibrella aquatilis TaxID=2817059 RepID=A0A939K026_9BACT|nr:hypothetical protein [Fibrella aquatilis]MBO0932033.1 hypothetical protein [Fibrella aquatilis]